MMPYLSPPIFTYVMGFHLQVCGDKASTKLVNEVQALINGSELIFASYGKGKELDVFPFLRHFGNSTWKEIQKWSKLQWTLFNAILQNRKVDPLFYKQLDKKKIKKVLTIFQTII